MENKPKLIYILPNLFTAGSAFLGIISILASANGEYMKAITYIVLSLILDGLDGRVARLTKTTSKFGVEFDSLADLVAFGVAPALLFYFSIGYNFGRFGALLTAMFVVFGAIRLARFNVMSGTCEPNVFIGLPIPSAAIVSAFWVGIYNNYDFMHGFEPIFIVIMAGLSVLMVSNVRYPSFKKVDFKRANYLKTLVYLVIIFSMLYLCPLESATILITIYTIYGIIRAIWARFFAKNIKLTKENR
ncbi:CDP-diacylglycerol--serine O-phosphatidyltransferase [Campylobacter fetus]|uniref:CDP-diacylglycerol--serine O-phosphatidyltransferase n=1 Tax=Campylobacter fetus TaxID=196 RepID=UPI000FC9EE04|nr:CDP-diacylglycerol--serine O-phosphatidyltransferase [Campylobacter fetus]QQF52091.1 CDP-diacylglycerol--serine O-phosphatidyltransferase [Campylobacter fetus subsp. venerealis]RUT50593.1 CDP-diacylglycerol--serine O-phosphatidyltransferase [Campylobacter fetus]RUT50910.1 CDP-diacylglycerol--serine O-phosphatidyltransferase [Campylobacter fetus]